MLRKNFLRLGAAVALVTGLAMPPAAADTLTDALILAYRTSPLLEANRAQLRGLDEEVPQARALRRPQVEAFGTGSASRRLRSSNAESEFLSTGLQTSLRLYDGGETRAAIESARATIAAGRADLRATEQIVLFRAVQAYMDVRRDLEFLSLARNDLRVLEEQLRAAHDRFEVGEITRTDVNLTEARLAASRARLAAAEGALEVSRASYLAAVGKLPEDLQPPPPIPALPSTLEEAMAIATQRNPDIIAAQFAERAAVFDFERATSARRPQISATAEVAWQDQFETGINTERRDVAAQAGLTASVPLYSGGQVSSLIRQAQTLVEARQSELQSTARDVREAVAAAWSELEVARAQIPARREQVVAARATAEGFAEEARVGARSTLDVLDADQDELEAEADLVQAERDEYVAAYNLLQAMGLLTVEHLGLGIETYDPDVYFSRVQSGPTGGEDRSVLDRIRSRWE